MTTRTTDGRRLRSELNKQKIVDALMALVRDGDLSPTAEAVAMRSGVGVRTVFRQFADVDSLHREISAVMTARLLPRTAEPFQAPTWQGRIDELARRRADLFEEIMPFKRAADVHAARSSAVQEERAHLSDFQRRMVKRILPAELTATRPELLDALDLALCLDTWVRLRTVQGLSTEASLATILLLARSLLPPSDDAS